MEAKQPITVEIFDPPMCCPTGLCGPSIDPALLDISEAILKLKTEFDGRATIDRYLLGQQPAKFVQHLEVIGRLKQGGVPVLPITVVNGVIRKERAYPSYSELKTWIQQG